MKCRSKINHFMSFKLNTLISTLPLHEYFYWYFFALAEPFHFWKLLPLCVKQNIPTPVAASRCLGSSSNAFKVMLLHGDTSYTTTHLLYMMLGTWEPMIRQDWTHYELNLRHPPEPWQVLAGKSERSSSTHWEIGAAGATWSLSSFSSWLLLLPDVLHPSGATIPQVVPSANTFLGWWSCACPLTDAVLSRLSAGISIWTKWSRPEYCCFFFSFLFFFLLKLKAKNAFVSLLWLQS